MENDLLTPVSRKQAEQMVQQFMSDFWTNYEKLAKSGAVEPSMTTVPVFSRNVLRYTANEMLLAPGEKTMLANLKHF